MHHPQVVQSPIVNDCLKVKIDGYTETQIVPKFLYQVSIRELHNNLVSSTKYGGLKEERDEYDHIIISDSTLRSLLSPQLKKMSSRYKVMCGCECCISAKSMHSSLISWRDSYVKNSRISAKILKTEGLGGKQIADTKLIKIQSCPMGVIFTPKNMTRQRQQFVLTHSLIMRYHTGNVYCDVFPNVLALIFLTKKQMIIIPTPVLQLFLKFII